MTTAMEPDDFPPAGPGEGPEPGVTAGASPPAPAAPASPSPPPPSPPPPSSPPPSPPPPPAPYASWPELVTRAPPAGAPVAVSYDTGWPRPAPARQARRAGRTPGAIVAVIVAIVVFVTAFGAGRNGGFGDSNTSSSRSSVVSDNGGSGDAATIGARVSPAVVNINTTTGLGKAAGTGMLLTSDGVVLTNNHVIDGATDIQVEIGGNGSMRSAKVLGYSVTEDVAVIKIRNVSNLQTVSLADSSRVNVNDRVVAVGNALGRGGDPTITSGVVAALNQTITAGDANGGDTETLRGMIQISADIQPGDSGGPLLNAGGQVIGMNTAASSGGFFRQSAANVAFAIPINSARAIAEQILAGKESATIHIGERGILGVSIYADAQRGAFGRTGGSGARISAVETGSPASGAGMKANDVIVGINDTTIRSSTDLNTAMSPFHPDDKVKVTWIDGSGQQRSATVTLELGPPA